MERAFLGMSHSPLIGLNPVAADVERQLHGAIAAARQLAQDFRPELVVLVGPDHYNGFFNELMPPFCVGTQASAVGDYQSPAGALNVDADLAVRLAEHLMDADFDVAVSRRMRVDHGFAQALQMLWGGLDTPPVVPIFMNAVAQPGIPRVRRCRALGEALGKFLDGLPRRTLLIGSGGLSHEPPVPLRLSEKPDLVQAYLRCPERRCNVRVVLMRQQGQDFTVAAKLDLPALPRSSAGLSFAPAALFDIDGDGKEELLVRYTIHGPDRAALGHCIPKCWRWSRFQKWRSR